MSDMTPTTPTIPPPGTTEREGLKQRLERALEIVNELAQKGDKAFQMCVPAQESDTDLFLTATLNDALALLDEVVRLEKERDYFKQNLEEAEVGIQRLSEQSLHWQGEWATERQRSQAMHRRAQKAEGIHKRTGYDVRRQVIEKYRSEIQRLESEKKQLETRLEIHAKWRREAEHERDNANGNLDLSFIQHARDACEITALKAQLEFVTERRRYWAQETLVVDCELRQMESRALAAEKEGEELREAVSWAIQEGFLEKSDLLEFAANNPDATMPEVSQHAKVIVRALSGGGAEDGATNRNEPV